MEFTCISHANPKKIDADFWSKIGTFCNSDELPCQKNETVGEKKVWNSISPKTPLDGKMGQENTKTAHDKNAKWELFPGPVHMVASTVKCPTVGSIRKADFHTPPYSYPPEKAVFGGFRTRTFFLVR